MESVNSDFAPLHCKNMCTRHDTAILPFNFIWIQQVAGFPSSQIFQFFKTSCLICNTLQTHIICAYSQNPVKWLTGRQIKGAPYPLTSLDPYRGNLKGVWSIYPWPPKSHICMESPLPKLSTKIHCHQLIPSWHNLKPFWLFSDTFLKPYWHHPKSSWHPSNTIWHHLPPSWHCLTPSWHQLTTFWLHLIFSWHHLTPT